VSIELRKFRTAQKQVKQFDQALNQARKEKLNVKKCEELVKQAHKALKENNYKKVSSTITEAKKLLKESKRHHVGADKLNKIHEMVKKAREGEIDLKKLMPMVEQAEKHLEQGEYKKFSKQSTLIRRSLDEATKYKNANDIIIKAQQAIEEAKVVGSSVKTATRLLGQAKTALKKKKFTNVHKNARSAIKLAIEGRITAIRRKASSAISAAQFLIKDVKDFGVDVNEAEKLLDLADKAYNKKLFEEAEEKAREAEKVAKLTFDNKKKEYLERGIKETLVNVDFVIEELEEINFDTSNIKKLYADANARAAEGDFETADKLAKDLEKTAREILDQAREQHRVKKAKEEIENSKIMIEEAKKMGIEVSAIDGLLDDAIKLFEKEKYDESVKKIDELKEQLTIVKDNITKKQTQSLIESTAALINDAKNLGADLTEAESIMKKAKSNFKAKDYAKAEELVKKCQVMAKKAWDEYRNEQIKRLFITSDKVIQEAEKAGIDVSEPQNLMTQASVKIEEEDFNRAEELINEAEAMASKNLDGHRITQSKEAVKNLENVCLELKDSDYDLSEFKELINKTKDSIKTKDFEAANEYIKQAESISSRILIDERLKVYSNKIGKSKELISKTKEIGLDTKELDKLLAEAETIYSNKDFENIDKYIDQIESKTNTIFKERRKMISTQVLRETRESIIKSREVGANVTKAEGYLNEAEKTIGEDEFDILYTEDLLTKADKEAKNSWVKRKSEITADAVSNAKNMIMETKEMGADVSEAEKLLGEAEEMFEDEDFEEIDDYLKKVKDMVQTTQTQRKSELANEAVTSTKALLAETREMGGDVTEAEKILQQAEGMFKDEDFKSLDEYIKKAENALKHSQVELKREETSKKVSSTRVKIDEGREKGANVTEAEELLAQAENMLLSESDFEKVENLIQMSQTSLASSWDQYKGQKLIDEISNMHGKIEKFRAQGVNVSKTEELLHKAEIEYKNERFENVESLIAEANEIIEKDYEEQFTKKITLLIHEVQNVISKAKNLDLDISAGEAILKDAIEEFEKKNYSKAEELAKKAKEIVKELIESYDKEETQNLLDRINNLIKDAKALNIDVSPAERLFRQAKALFKTNEYESCRKYALKSENILNSLAKKNIKDKHPHLSVDIKGEGIQADKWNKVKVQILNDGQIKAQNIELGLKGDFEIKGKRKIEAINPDDQVELEVGFNTKKTGDIPIKILAKCSRPFDSNEYKFTNDVKLQVQSPGSFVIEDVFLIYIDGCLITHLTREYREIVDEDIFSGMLIAVQNFVTDSFRKTGEEGLKRLDFGESKILIEFGQKFFLAVVMEGDQPGMLPLFMVETINEVQDKFGSILEDWDGNIEKLQGINEIIEKLLFLSVVPGSDELQLTGESGQESKIMTVKSMISDAKELGVETSEVEKELQKAETVAESSDYSSVWEHIQNATEMARKAKRDFYHDDVNKALSSIKEDMANAKEMGADIEDAEVVYTQMEEMIENEAFSEVIEKAKECKQIIQESQKHVVILKSLGKLDENLTIANEWGVDISATEDEKKQIVTALEEKNYSEAQKLIDKLNDDLKKNLTKISMESLPTISNLTKGMDEVKQYEINTAEPQGLVTSAMEAIKESDLTKAKELLEQANNKLTTEKEQYFESKSVEVINAAKKSMAELQKMNINTDEEQKLISEAEKNLKDKNFKDAHEIAQKVSEKLDNTIHDKKSEPIINNITKVEVYVKEARAHGISEDLNHWIEELLSQARSALDSKSYETAEELMKKANEIVSENYDFIDEEKDKLREQLDSTLSIITTSKETGMDTTEAEGLVARMKEVLDSGDIEATRAYLEDIQKNLEKMQKPIKIQELNTEIKKLAKYANETKEKNLDTKEAEHLIENAKAILDTEDLESVEEYLKKARAALDSVNKSHRAIVISETIQSTYKLVNEVKEMGAEVKYAEDLLKQAEAMLQGMDLESAENFVTNALTTAQERKKEFLLNEASEQIKNAEESIAIAKNSGLNTVDPERLLSQAKKYFEAEELENANQYALNAQHLIEDIKEKKKEKYAKEALAYVQQLYTEIKEKGVNVIQADAPLMQAEASLSNKDYEIAINYTNNAKNILREIKKPFSIKLANTAIEKAKKAILNAQNYGADVTTAQNLFNEAQQAATSQDYDTAEEKAKKAEKLALEAQEHYYDNYISNEIKTLKENIDNLNNQGFDVTMAQELLSSINSLYLDKNFQEIGEKIQTIRELIIKMEEGRYIERARDSISYSKAMIKYIKHNIKDIGPRIKQPERIIQSAEEAFKNKDYIRAEQIALDSQKAVKNIKHSNLEQFLFVFKQLQAEEMLSQTKNIISNIKKLGLDLSEAEEFIQKAEEAFKDDITYNQAQEFLTEAKIKAHEKENEFQEKNAGNAISTAESLILTLKQTGVNVESADKFLNQAKTALEIREFKKSILFAGKAKFTAKKLMGENAVT